MTLEWLLQGNAFIETGPAKLDLHVALKAAKALRWGRWVAYFPTI
jgi:hypothetical protein